MELMATELGGVWVASGIDSRSINDPRYGLNDPRLIDELFSGGSESSSGETVSVETALCLSAVWEIVSMISADVAKLPLAPYTRTTDDQGEEIGKKIDKTHAAWPLLAKMANEHQTSLQFRRTIITHSLLANNGYAFVERRGKIPTAMRILDPQKTCIKHDRDRVYVETSDNWTGMPMAIDLENVVHIHGLSWDGFQGMELVRFARDTFGMALAAQNFTGRFFKNGVQAGGFLKLPLGATKKQADTLEEGFFKKFHNSENHFRTLVLRDGAEWMPNTFNAKDADLKELKNQAKVDVCNFFGVNPAKVGVPGYNSYNSQEQANREYLDNCLSTHLASEVNAYEPKLFTEDEYLGDSMKLEHNTNALLRMDLDKRAGVYNGAIRNGWMNPNQVRAKENMEPRPGGDEYASLGQVFGGTSDGGADNKPVDPTDPNEPGEEKKAAAGRSVSLNRVIFGVTQHARAKSKSVAAFLDWTKGKLTSHRALALSLGVDQLIVDAMLKDFEDVKADDATIARAVEDVCQKWEGGQ